jgi:putative chitinase
MMLDTTRLQARLNARGHDAGAEDGVAGPRTFAALFRFCGAREAAVALGEAAPVALTGARLLHNPLRLAHALSQWAVESQNFTRFVEDLNYSATRLRAVWPSRFPSIEAAMPFASNPAKLAEKVYGGRMGNTGHGHAWMYRGRGPTMLTGRANYEEAQRLTGLPLLSTPALAAEPGPGLAIACAYWSARHINNHADADDSRAVRRAVNGGTIGLAHSERALAKLKGLLL